MIACRREQAPWPMCGRTSGRAGTHRSKIRRPYRTSLHALFHRKRRGSLNLSVSPHSEGCNLGDHLLYPESTGKFSLNVKRFFHT
jgi:hypothetical protein